jgi:hypothetical protein
VDSIASTGEASDLLSDAVWSGTIVPGVRIAEHDAPDDDADRSRLLRVDPVNVIDGIAY